MGQLYREATLTIYASASKSSKDGILKKTNVGDLERRVTLDVFSDERENVEVMIEQRLLDEECLRVISIRGPLHQRGWTLQEMTLAPRQLHYGEKSIYWRCREEFYSLEGNPRGTLWPEKDWYDSNPILANAERSGPEESDDDDDASVLAGFYDLVSEYSTRALTRDTDKLPAMAGLCKFLHPYIGGTYLAGLWSRDIAYGLLWYKEMRWSEHVTAYRAPSWSWAVTNESILYDVREQSSIEVELVAHDTRLSNEANPYGEVESSRLFVRGPTMPLARSRQLVHQRFGGNQSGGAWFDEPESEIEDPYAHLFRIQTGDGEHLYMSMPWTFDRQEEVDIDTKIDTELWSSQPYVALMVLKEWESEDFVARGLILRVKAAVPETTYERVGVFRTPRLVGEGWISEFEDETIILV